MEKKMELNLGNKVKNGKGNETKWINVEKKV
jgi:hypothetical protein